MFALPAYKEMMEGKKEFFFDCPKFQQFYSERITNLNAKYVQIMESSNGDPRHIEFKHSSNEQWAFIVDEMSSPEEGTYRVQYFDLRGFYSHSTFESLELAIDALVTNSMHNYDKGRLDVVSKTVQWNRGVDIDDVYKRLNFKIISWDQAKMEINLITEKYADAPLVVAACQH